MPHEKICLVIVRHVHQFRKRSRTSLSDSKRMCTRRNSAAEGPATYKPPPGATLMIFAVKHPLPPNMRCVIFLFRVFHAPQLYFILCRLFQPQSLCLVHTGKPTGVAVSHCVSRSATTVI